MLEFCMEPTDHEEIWGGLQPDTTLSQPTNIRCSGFSWTPSRWSWDPKERTENRKKKMKKTEQTSGL